MADLAAAGPRRGAGWRVNLPTHGAVAGGLGTGARRRGRPRTWRCSTAGGTTNATFRVQTGQGAFVVRLHAPYALDLGVDRKREAVLHAAAARRASPAASWPRTQRVVTSSPSSWTVRRGGRSIWTMRPALEALAQTLARPACRCRRPRSRRWICRRYCADMSRRLPRRMPPRRRISRPSWRAPAKSWRDRPKPGARVHHPRRSEPLRISSARFAPRLIDWEYAASGDPLADLACLVAYYPQVLRHGTALLRDCGLSDRVPG